MVSDVCIDFLVESACLQGAGFEVERTDSL